MAHEPVGELVALLPLLRARLERADPLGAAPEACPLPPLDAALIVFLAESGPCAQALLARRLGTASKETAAALTRLAEHGFTERRPDGEWSLSPVWKGPLERSVAAQRAYAVALLDQLPAAERRVFVRALRLLAST